MLANDSKQLLFQALTRHTEVQYIWSLLNFWTELGIGKLCENVRAKVDIRLDLIVIELQVLDSVDYNHVPFNHWHQSVLINIATIQKYNRKPIDNCKL